MDLPDRFIHQTTRYILGRRTYAVAEHTEWLIENWHRIPDHEKAIIQKDLEREFFQDDILREHNLFSGPLGMTCDRREWEKVRALWS